jgi:hypothetical protein
VNGGAGAVAGAAWFRHDCTVMARGFRLASSPVNEWLTGIGNCAFMV